MAKNKQPKPAKYRCNLCKSIVKRNSAKAWIKSICTKSNDANARLYRI